MGFLFMVRESILQTHAPGKNQREPLTHADRCFGSSYFGVRKVVLCAV